MTKIKICGITNMIETDFLNKCLPDYAGFVFAKSRRQVTSEVASELCTGLVPHIKRVGVFVNHEAELVADIAREVGLDAVQLHGSENRLYIELLRSLLKNGTEVWKALRVDAEHMPSPDLIQSMDIDRLLLDTYVEDTHGGTGKCFDWSLVSQLVTQMETPLPIVLAGGLKPENVRQAMESALPFAVDTSSGVETEGIKDVQKLLAFIEAVRGGI